LINEVTKLFRAIDWVDDLVIFARESNLGCGASPREAITAAFEREESLIVLEDDCLPSSDFFSWVNQLLSAFADDERVGAICGFQSCPKSLVAQHDFFWASSLFAGWGWATWRRGWAGYEADIANWREEIPASFYLRRGNVFAGLRWFRANWDWVKGRESDIWDHQFGYLLAKRRQLVLKPPVNLIENIGTNERATHTRPESSVRSQIHGERLPATATDWPRKLKVNVRADRWILKHDYQAQSTASWLGDLFKAGTRRLTGRSG
jgi:hypothetical protein